MDVVPSVAEVPPPNYDEQLYDDIKECDYQGTTDQHIKIYLIGAFASAVAIFSIIFNTFLTIVFLKTPSLRSTPLFYFGILAVIDIIMGFNYLALMSVQVGGKGGLTMKQRLIATNIDPLYYVGCVLKSFLFYA